MLEIYVIYNGRNEKYIFFRYIKMEKYFEQLIDIGFYGQECDSRVKVYRNVWLQ